MNAGAVLAGRYELVSEIGRDQFAVIWEAIDAILDRRVALKILDASNPAESPARAEFLRMAHAGAGLNHPSIVAVYDTGDHEGTPFLVMEFMKGGSLGHVIAGGPLEPARAAEIGRAACSALHYAHGRGVAHGRLDPAVVLLSASGKPKLADFSIPRSSEREKSSDLVALGELLYFCLTRRHPEMNSRGRLNRPSDFSAGIPRALDDVVMRALQTPFKDAAAMGTALSSTTGDNEQGLVTPNPPGASEPAPSFVKSEGRWLARLAVLIVIVAGVALLAINLAGRPLTDIFGPADPAELPRDARAQIYDPVGDGGNGRENDHLAPLAIDGDPGTDWHTEWYRTAPLGGNKPGVGLVLDLGSAEELKRMAVESVAAGWQGSIRTSDDGSNWSDPGPTIIVDQTQDFEVEGKHRWLMIWITQLVETPGQGTPELPFSVGIAEVNLFPM